LNSHANGKNYKAPLSKDNANIWRKIFADATAYLLALRIPGQQLMATSMRSACIKGLVTTMRSLNDLMEEFVIPGNLGLL
jgi:hypothetical protein